MSNVLNLVIITWHLRCWLIWLCRKNMIPWMNDMFYIYFIKMAWLTRLEITSWTRAGMDSTLKLLILAFIFFLVGCSAFLLTYDSLISIFFGQVMMWNAMNLPAVNRIILHNCSLMDVSIAKCIQQPPSLWNFGCWLFEIILMSFGEQCFNYKIHVLLL